MGGNQAIEGAAVLVNMLSETSIFQQSPSPSPRSGDDDHPVLMIPRDTLQTALARYTADRQPRAREIARRAGIVCRAQLCHGGPAAAVLQELPGLRDGDWLFRGFAGFADAPVLEMLEVTRRGRFYDWAIGDFRKKLAARQGGAGGGDNAALFDIAT